MSTRLGDHVDVSIARLPAAPGPASARPVARPRLHLASPLLRRAIWFGSVGALSAAVQLALLTILVNSGFTVPAATIVAVHTSALLNFSLNYSVTWRDRFSHLSRPERRAWFLPLYIVFVLTTPTLWLKILGISLLGDRIGGSLVFSWMITEALGAALNFIGADRISFGAMSRVTSTAPHPGDLRVRLAGPARAAWQTMRPEQWVKNVFVLAAAPFAVASGAADRLLPLALAALAFCAASSSVYLVNDWLDRDRDRLHPTKRFRPIAAGTLSARLALALSVLLAAGAVTAGIAVQPELGLLIALYLGLSHAYSLKAKHVPVLDLLLVGGLYGLRVAAGFLVCGIDAATAWPWVVLATLLGIAVVTGKRRGEWRIQRHRQAVTRPVLQKYPPWALPRMYWMSALATVVAVIAAMWQLGPVALMAGAIVLTGFVRFWQAIERDDRDRHPHELLLADPSLCTLVAGFAGVLTILLLTN